MNSLLPSFGYTFRLVEPLGGPLSGCITDGHGEYFLGQSPGLRWAEHTPEPAKRYARVSLTASASAARHSKSISFLIERGLLTMLRSGDVMHVGAYPALGLSILRDDILIAAAGDATTLSLMPLGADVAIRFPDPAAVHPEIAPGASYRSEDFPTRPVELCIAGIRRAMWRGRPTMGPYDVFVTRGLHGNSRMSVEMARVCPQTAAHTSAQLMDRDGYQLVEP
jgi:hypothetical protein